MHALPELATLGADLRYKHHCLTSHPSPYGPKIKTPLHTASSKGHAEIVSWILDECPGAVDDISPDVDRGALHYASNRKSNTAVLELLITKGGMDPNMRSRNDWSPLHYSVGSSRLDLTKFLVSKGADIHAETGHGGNLLSLAACSKSEELSRWLIDQGVSPNCQDKQGLTALHRLARFGDLSMLKLFVEYGHADVRLLDNSGCSALEEADRNNMSEIATYLWTKGCESTSIKNPDGLGPTTWFRLRHVNLPAARYGCGFAHIDSKLVIFSGLGHGPDYVNHDNENPLNDHATGPLNDTHYADLNTIEHLSLLPAGVTPTRPEVSLSSLRCGNHIRLDADGLGGWSHPCGPDQTLQASIVTATKPFKRSEKFGYFELHVVNAGELRILTIGLVDEKFPINGKQPGWDKDSYGYHGDDGGCFHNNGAGKPWGERFNPGDVIGCGINFERNGEIFWTKNGKFLGVSHIGPQSDAYYPAIGVENDGAIFRINFGKTPFQFSFIAPTLTWHMTSPQPEYSSSNSRLIPLPDVGEILAIPDRLVALGSKVWLFNLRTNKWRTNATIGERPTILPYSQHVRLGNAVYVWNPAQEASEERITEPLGLLRLDLEYWEWLNLFTYNVMRDDKLDNDLNTVDSDADESDDASDSDSDSDSDDEADQAAKEQKRQQKLQQRVAPISSSPISSATTSIAATSAASTSETKNGEPEDERAKLTPKERLAGRTQDVITLLKNEYKSSFMVAMDDNLVFVAHMKMLCVNPKTFEFSVHELRGARPKITHHSSLAVGTDIITFGGWDDRKQQNELFILDTRSKLWYKPHTGGLIFPRPRNNHASLYFETTNPIFAIDPSDDADNTILAKHESCLPAWAKADSRAKIPETKAATAASEGGAKNKDDDVYRFCIFAMGWNGANTMYDIDFVALDTRKSSEALGKMLDGPADTSATAASSASGGHIDFDITLEVTDNGETTQIGAHKAILWARSDHFKALLTEDLVNFDDASAESTAIKTVPIQDASPEHVKALVNFLYTDHVNVVGLHAEYRKFIELVEKLAPNHVQRLVAEYLLTKVYEPEKLNEELGELLSSGAFSDVSFRVGDKVLKAHKVIIAARSPFFRALLTGGLVETRQNVIDFEDAQPEEFEALLRYLYSRTIDYANISDYIVPLFTLATRCEARGLKHTLESLIAFNLDSSNVASLLVLADQLTALSLKQAAIEFIKKSPSEVTYEDDAQKTLVSDLLR